MHGIWAKSKLLLPALLLLERKKYVEKSYVMKTVGGKQSFRNSFQSKKPQTKKPKQNTTYFMQFFKLKISDLNNTSSYVPLTLARFLRPDGIQIGKFCLVTSAQLPFRDVT